MEFFLVTSQILTLLILSLMTGRVARNSGRKFWTWFWISLPFPVFSLVILYFLPDKTKQLKMDWVYETDEFNIYD